jgi:hypothetical protein
LRTDKGEIRPTIAITGADAEYDHIVVQRYFGERAFDVAPKMIDIIQTRQLRENKFSVLPHNYNGQDLAPGTAPEVSDLVAQQQVQHRRWNAMLALAHAMFERIGVEYVLMKALASPLALMSDVDFLVPQPRDIARIAAELERADFALYRFRLLAHPLKIMAVPADQSLKAPPGIDLYPDAMWVRKHVLDGPGVIVRRHMAEARGISIWQPCLEDDLYLVATHAFARGDITLAELDHGARLVRHAEFDWAYLIQSATAFGCVDAIYIYLRLLECACRSASLGEAVPPEVIGQLERFAASRGLRSWLDVIEHDLRFPLRIPLWLSTIRSGMYHLPAIRKRVRFSELLWDTACHGFMVGTHLLRRD